MVPGGGVGVGRLGVGSLMRYPIFAKICLRFEESPNRSEIKND